jgi:hypothetical protein
MTLVLRDSLGGNCRTVMVATVSGEAEHMEESISTCRFAQRVALIRNEVRACKAEHNFVRVGWTGPSDLIGRQLQHRQWAGNHAY